VKRREFIILLGGALMASPRAVFAQSNRVPRIGVLVGLDENDAEANLRFANFRQELERLGWSEGRNVHIDYRFAPATCFPANSSCRKNTPVMLPPGRATLVTYPRAIGS
jgi:hypothetical protein